VYDADFTGGATFLRRRKLEGEVLQYYKKPALNSALESAMVSLAALALAQNALTEEERSRVLVLYARGLRLLFTVGSPRQSAAQWAVAWEAVTRELLILVALRHQRLSETARLATHHFFSPPYQISRAQLLALYQVMAQRQDAEAQGLVRLTRLLDPAWRRRQPPQQRPAQKRQRRRGAHRKKLGLSRPRQPRTAGRPRARAGPGNSGAVPVRARVEAVLAWLRQVRGGASAEDILSYALELLNKREGVDHHWGGR
jgi:hypothetical protein